jgi:peroxidase
VTGSDLPNPRKIVLDILLKAEKKPRNPFNEPNQLLLLKILYVTHDMAHQVPVEAFDNCKEIRCCSSGNKKVLDPSVSHSACLPISIGKDDEFYKKADVGCLNMIRSESSSLPSIAQHGEVLNKVTSFMDHSIIYGSDDIESNKIRSFVGGKLNLGPNNVLPVDSKGKYTKISDRLTSVPLSAIWPILTARNHNSLASGLEKMNPKWSDEKLFQEARRINIAFIQRELIENLFVALFNTSLGGVYDETADPSTTLEFSSGAYRFFHFNLQPYMKLTDKDNKVETIPMSDTFGRIDLAEKRFDDVLRGALGDEMNFLQYTDEVIMICEKVSLCTTYLSFAALQQICQKPKRIWT